MEYGNLYLVSYYQYRNDLLPFTVKVFAHNEEECRQKVHDSGLIHYTDNYSSNSGYIDYVTVLEKNII